MTCFVVKQVVVELPAMPMVMSSRVWLRRGTEEVEVIVEVVVDTGINFLGSTPPNDSASTNQTI